MKNRALLVILSLALIGIGIYLYQSNSLDKQFEEWRENTGRNAPKKKKEQTPHITIASKIDSTGIFTLWVTGCAHLPHDFAMGRAPISEAIYQSESGPNPFNWDMMLFLGDFCSHPELPSEFDGRLAKQQLHSGKQHSREQIYCLQGNHDAVTGDTITTNSWFRKWIDPLGTDTNSGVQLENRPFAITGSYERYSYEVGNILFLVMSDRNDGNEPAGRAHSPKGHPAGRVTKATFFWWREMVEQNQDKIIVTCSHHMLKNTTIATEEFVGVQDGFHGNSSEHDFKGSSYLYFIDDEPDADYFGDYIKTNPGCIDIWLGAHTHISPIDTLNGKTFIARKNNVTFINAALLGHIKKNNPASSRLLTFNRNQPSAKLQVYLHDDILSDIGLYTQLDQEIPLSKNFVFQNDDKKTKKK